ncbi:MAG: hypothetical protein L6Q57_07515 [Alphaproteobacteria bacterium]|nr:hypothetical protein [Alphaproteobacteria bacterium]
MSDAELFKDQEALLLEYASRNQEAEFSRVMAMMSAADYCPFNASALMGHIIRHDNGTMMSALLALVYKTDADLDHNSYSNLAGLGSLTAGMTNQELQTMKTTKDEVENLSRLRPSQGKKFSFSDCLDVAGLGQGIAQPERHPHIIGAILSSDQFALAVLGNPSQVAVAIANLLMARDSQKLRLQTLFEMITRDVGEDVAQTIARDAFVAATALASQATTQGTFKDPLNTGHDDNFACVLDQLSQNGADAALDSLTKAYRKLSTKLERLKMLFDRAGPAMRETVTRRMAAHGTPEMLEIALCGMAQVFDGAGDVALLQAACGTDDDCNTPQKDSLSLNNLEVLLRQNYGEKDIFDAMVTAAISKKDGHFARLVHYAAERCPQVFSRATQEENSLLMVVITVKDGYGRFNTMHNPRVERMATVLLQHIPPQSALLSDRKGNTPLSILGQRNMHASGLYATIRSLMENTMRIQFDVQAQGALEKARLTARAQEARNLLAEGMPPDLVAAILNMGGTSAPALAPPPAARAAALPPAGAAGGAAPAPPSGP